MQASKTSEIIHVLGGTLSLEQIPHGFRTGLDAVMLAAACPVKPGQSVLDLGCGVGSAGLCVLARVSGATLTGIDIQQDHIDLATRNAALNNLDKHAAFSCLSILDYKKLKALNTVDHVICNPPYIEAGDGTPSPSAKRAKATGLSGTALADWIACAFDALKGRGSLTLIHRADTLDKIFEAMGKRFGAAEIIPLWPGAGKPAGRVIVRAWKHRKGPVSIKPGLVLHNPDGSYTLEAENILRAGGPIL